MREQNSAAAKVRVFLIALSTIAAKVRREDSKPFEELAAKRPAAKAAWVVCTEFSSLKAAAPSDLPAGAEVN